MSEWKTKSRRKKTGGIDNSFNAATKKLSDKGGSFSKTTVSKDADKRYQSRTRGGGAKVKIAKATTVLISQAGKTVKGKLITVTENAANKQFIRQNVITKSAIAKVIIDGKEVNVKITSRPGQSGQVSGVIVK